MISTGFSHGEPMDTPAPEIRESDSSRVFCAGGADALGHPGVYLETSKAGFAVCPYCSRRFADAPEAERH
jgi:uncharacterized Zn-finger protein